jgi:hypothetical protein
MSFQQQPSASSTQIASPVHQSELSDLADLRLDFNFEDNILAELGQFNMTDAVVAQHVSTWSPETVSHFSPDCMETVLNEVTPPPPTPVKERREREQKEHRQQRSIEIQMAEITQALVILNKAVFDMCANHLHA